jgi:hypothetical protein
MKLRSAGHLHVGPLMADFDPYDSLVPVFLETEIPKRVVQIGTAIARIRLDDGSVFLAEIHWYEATGIGKRELKIKRLIEGY